MSGDFTYITGMIFAALWQTCTMFISGRCVTSQIPRFMGPTWGPPGSCRPQMGPMLAPWTLLSGIPSMRYVAWRHSRDYYLYLVTPHLCQIFGIHLMNVLWVPNLQMSYSDLIKWLETRTRVLVIYTFYSCLLHFYPSTAGIASWYMLLRG